MTDECNISSLNDQGEGCSLLWPCSYWLRDGHALIDGIDDCCQTIVPGRQSSITDSPDLVPVGVCYYSSQRRNWGEGQEKNAKMTSTVAARKSTGLRTFQLLGPMVQESMNTVNTMVAFQDSVETIGYQSVPSARRFALSRAASTYPNI